MNAIVVKPSKNSLKFKLYNIKRSSKKQSNMAYEQYCSRVTVAVFTLQNMSCSLITVWVLLY